MKKLRIAIDGPAAAGKSTVAKIVAGKLSYLYIDTGAMYRSLTYKALKQNIDLHDENELKELLAQTKITLEPTEDGQIVYVDGENVTDEIRQATVTNSVSHVAVHSEVREEMVNRQQQLAKQGAVVMDGRDIGTHVIPDAEIKVFLLASVDERAQRRHEENISKGFPSDLEQLKVEIARRDKIDSEREVAPLKKADDATEIDTTSLSIPEVVDQIMLLVERKG
ncbi:MULTISPECIES: (d)CMP kinase [Rossellomorea]|uniref:(d)CMP kinase n=1 Tax=Rossellomorea TaxID=2837508 RepID=UPI0011E90C44|nr:MULTISPECIES: (d)CMP kinase [Rossellomorea]MDT9024682.1 (d)CMP kinase [Rossellomorea sp. YC4-1]TYS87388.1 (d)CMP kinase [Rossellomorea aquimaris]